MIILNNETKLLHNLFIMAHWFDDLDSGSFGRQMSESLYGWVLTKDSFIKFAELFPEEIFAEAVTITHSFSDTDKDSAYRIRALHNSHDNQLRIDTLYDKVFHPVIKYSENKKQASYYEDVWLLVSNHFNGDN